MELIQLSFRNQGVVLNVYPFIGRCMVDVSTP